MLTHSELKELFDCREDGMLIRKIKSGFGKIGDVAGLITDMHCFYHINEEQFIGLKEGLYRLDDFGEKTVYDNKFRELFEISITILIGALVSDFVIVPINLIDWNEQGILTPDFTQAIEANRWRSN